MYLVIYKPNFCEKSHARYLHPEWLCIRVVDNLNKKWHPVKLRIVWPAAHLSVVAIKYQNQMLMIKRKRSPWSCALTAIEINVELSRSWRCACGTNGDHVSIKYSTVWIHNLKITPWMITHGFNCLFNVAIQKHGKRLKSFKRDKWGARPHCTHWKLPSTHYSEGVEWNAAHDKTRWWRL